jgi:hypothetical protein
LEDLTDILIANFNNTPHGSIGYKTPLEYLEFLCERDSEWPTLADPFEVERTLAFTKTVIVHGGIDIGRRPYIIFQGVKYTSDVFKRAYHLVNTKISIEIRRDLRTVRPYASNGAELGILHAAPPWNLTPHTLEMRRAVNSLVQRKVLHYLGQSDPIIALLEHFESAAHKGSHVPPLYLEMRRYLTSYLEEFRSESTPAPQPALQADIRRRKQDALEIVKSNSRQKDLVLSPRKAING